MPRISINQGILTIIQLWSVLKHVYTCMSLFQCVQASLRRLPNPSCCHRVWHWSCFSRCSHHPVSPSLPFFLNICLLSDFPFSGMRNFPCLAVRFLCQIQEEPWPVAVFPADKYVPNCSVCSFVHFHLVNKHSQLSMLGIHSCVLNKSYQVQT